MGRAVRKQYIPPVHDPAENGRRKGSFGFLAVDVAVTMVDGTFHSVDSFDVTLKAATRMSVAETLGTQRLLTGRRGQILGLA